MVILSNVSFLGKQNLVTNLGLKNQGKKKD